MKNKTLILVLLIFSTITLFDSCKKDGDDDPSINIFTIEDDIALGLSVEQEIAANPIDFPILDYAEYPEAYYHIYRIRDSLLNTGKVAYSDVFDWQIKIIHNDSVLNAFAVPGGYMYFYTGIIKFLDNESQFAGVLGHEMAHVARRHSTDQLTKAFGLQILFSILLGDNPTIIAQIAADLASGLSTLAFSRANEYEADEFSVKYLYETAYDSRGIDAFFQKMEGAAHPPTFLSTHPSPEDRSEKITEVWISLGGKVGLEFEESYQEFKNSLP